MSLKRKLIILFYKVYYTINIIKRYERESARIERWLANQPKHPIPPRDPNLKSWEELDITEWSTDEILKRMG